MRLLARSIVLGALLLAPATAMAFVWPWAKPSVSETQARKIAKHHGFATIVDIDGTIDGDWRIKGKDAWGRKLELVIDGKTGEVEHAEMNAH
jgi:Peptidase propeptide and YPEB domain